ncbi:uncharacterized protein EV420DRAFT_1641015 [Desarmillaria tabescens]|uniref:Uncharacterized protein n=1 Tax=Armillaria tabescens TaxID=1929756 RepID=A0AA39TV04_ARMTA|nr:uncharacterized protein EV420DRAFT_1641015 [Desarmillaria tabescens]KAK0460470.1 hypothetical protein EV420DRAFT_1641015 [Desarmillaria tabescens]
MDTPIGLYIVVEVSKATDVYEAVGHRRAWHVQVLLGLIFEFALSPHNGTVFFLISLLRDNSKTFVNEVITHCTKILPSVVSPFIRGLNRLTLVDNTTFDDAAVIALLENTPNLEEFVLRESKGHSISCLTAKLLAFMFKMSMVRHICSFVSGDLRID